MSTLEAESFIDRIRRIVEDSAPPDPELVGAATENGDSQSGGQPVHRVEVAGIGLDCDTITDEFSGKTWVIPTGTFTEDLVHNSVFNIPNKNPDFHYCAYRKDEVGDMQAQGFVPVSRKETGVIKIVDPSVPQPLDTIHTIGDDMVLMKTPKVLADRRYEAQRRLCDAAVEMTKVRPSRDEAGIEIDGKPTLSKVKDERKAFDKDGDRLF